MNLILILELFSLCPLIIHPRFFLVNGNLLFSIYEILGSLAETRRLSIPRILLLIFIARISILEICVVGLQMGSLGLLSLLFEPGEDWCVVAFRPILWIVFVDKVHLLGVWLVSSVQREEC